MREEPLRPGAASREPRVPVAIVGIGCRFPGAVDSPESLWRALVGELDAITEIPPDRFDAASLYQPGPPAAGRIGTRWGGFLDDIDRFDAEFFALAPREAERLDPQQRLLLEVSWEALEDAGIPADRLAGSRTGVFVGVWLNDYEARLFADPGAVDFHMTTGSGRYAASGRISYALGLQGPAITVDCACSSSLVAVHLACQSLWSGESELALAGGANVILQPHITIAYSQSSMMAPDGRCKFGDARANGYVRSEGAAVVLLKRLDRALADGDPVYAVIRGTAVNNDGKSGEYMATPARAGQEEMLRLAYRDAGVSPGRIAYVEAHGTGTGAGDPVEIGALGAVLGDGRPSDRPCAIGSIKTNFGHTEGAAGVAGLAKAALVLRNRQIPKSLHFENPNPDIPWDRLPLYVPRELAPLAPDASPALAGVSSFGIAGTNAHVVLEEVPAPARESAAAPSGTVREERPGRAVLVPVSARSPAALSDLARAFEGLLDGEAPALTDLAYSAACRRAHLEERLAVVASDPAELRERLGSFADGGQAGPGAVRGRRRARRPRVVFVFPGQGSQWQGMARELLDEEPVFREALEACEAAMRPFVDWSLMDRITAGSDPQAHALDRIDVVQPVLVAVDVALAALWRAWGVEPDAVVGHSMGEVAAAHVAGALDLEDAFRVVCLRSRLMRRTSGQGLMAAVELSLEEARVLLSGHEDRVSIAASNSPRSTILSGDPETLRSLVEALEAREVFCRMVNVDVASHSPQMEPLRDELRAGLEGLAPRATGVPLYSTVTGGRVEGEALDPEHWARNLRHPVLFAGVVEQLLANEHDAFIEMSPHPVLLPAIEQTARLGGRNALTLPSLRRQESERATMLQSLGALFVAGLPVDFGRLHPDGGRALRLPRYPWQRERFWYEPPAGRRDLRHAAGAHPLLGTAVRTATGTVVWEGELGTDRLPYLADHRVHGRPVLPAAAYLEMALAAAAEVFGGDEAAVSDVVFEEALLLADGAPSSLQVVVEPDGSHTAALRVFGRPAADAGSGAPWTLHARATLRVDGGNGTAAAAGAADTGLELRVTGDGAAAVTGEDHYRAMAARGLEYGARFQGVGELWRDAARGEALARIEPPEAQVAEWGSYRLHPALLDACLQILLQTVDGDGDPVDTYLPSALERFEIRRRPEPGETLRARAVRRDAADGLVGDVHLVDGAGRPLASATGLRFQRLPAGRDGRDWLYRPRWELATRSAESGGAPDGGAEEAGSPEVVGEAGHGARGETVSSPGAWLILADEGGVGRALGDRIEALGGRCVLATLGGPAESSGLDGFLVDPARPDALARLVEEAAEAAGPLEGVVHLWGLDGARDAGQAADQGAIDRGVVAVLHLVQALAAAGQAPSPRLCLVTAGAQPVAEEEPADPAQSLLWGMAGVLAHEHPELRCLCVDLDPADPAGDVEALLAELSAPGREDRLAFRAGARHAPRLVRHDAMAPRSSGGQGAGATAAEARPSEPYRVVTTAPGLLDHLTPRILHRRPPEPGEVEIEVRATGLNFMNVMSALGIYPGYPDGVGPLGIECAGVVARTGEDVDGLRAGDAVLAYAFDSLATHALADRHLVAPKPRGLGFAEAATLPIAFLTAYYALHHLARLERGERVLIHAASGGVGLAALQLARAAGARVFATAGSEAKREYLRSLGVEDVFDSRSLAFADQVLERTGGEGVDVVLNSLAGAAIARGLAVLRPYGRFVEIGKRDIHDDARLGLAPFRKNLSYFAVDLERMARERPELLGAMLQNLVARVDTGELEPLPLTEFPVTEVGDAFRHMAQARHVGKLVIRIQDSRELAGPALPPESPVRPDASYLVTGGLGGLGLAVAGWLAGEGARHLVLVGRSSPGEAARPVLRALEAQGVQVLAAQADVTRRAELEALLERVRTELPPLRGVVHAAGVLADGTVLGMDRKRFLRALAPKVEGARHLDELTRDEALDFFVLFSSATALLGTPGQANYAAANAFLDALAHARRARGLAALSINWGPWSDVGLAAARTDRGERLARQGLGSLSPQQGVAALARLLRSDPGPQVAVMRLDLDRWREFHPAAADAAFFDRVREAEAGPSTSTGPSASGILETLAAAAFESDRRALLETYIQEQTARVLRLEPARVALDRPLKTLGMDSLMTLELRNRLEADLGLALSATVVWNYPTVTLLAGYLAGRLGTTGGEEEAEVARGAEDAGADGATPDEAGADETLTRAEVEALLASELAGLDDLLGEG